MAEQRYNYLLFEDEFMGWGWRCGLCSVEEIPGFTEFDRNLQRRARRHIAKEHREVLESVYQPRGGARWTT